MSIDTTALATPTPFARSQPTAHVGETELVVLFDDDGFDLIRRPVRRRANAHEQQVLECEAVAADRCWERFHPTQSARTAQRTEAPKPPRWKQLIVVLASFWIVA